MACRAGSKCFSSYPRHSTIPQPNNFIMDLDLGPRFGTLIWWVIWDLDLGPWFWGVIWDLHLGPWFGVWFGGWYGTLIWDPGLGVDMGPTFRTPILELMPNVISKIKQNSRGRFGPKISLVFLQFFCGVYWFSPFTENLLLPVNEDFEMLACPTRPNAAQSLLLKWL
jgi:hypothetical protein